MKGCLVTSFFLSAAFVCACRPEGDRLPAYDELPDTAVVANVAGVQYTKADLERDCEIVEALLDASDRADQKQIRERNPLQCRRQMVDGFVRREALIKLGEHKGVSLSAAEALEFREHLLADVFRSCPQKTNVVDAVLGVRAEAFAANLRREALAANAEAEYRAELRMHISANADDVARESRRLADLRQKVLAANASLCRLATNAWRSIRAGNDFDVVGKKLVEMQEGVSYDASFEAAELPALASGELSAPLLTKDGIEIFRESGETGGERRVSRIFFKLETPEPEISPETIRERKLAEETERLYEVRMQQLRQALGVTVRELK